MEMKTVKLGDIAEFANGLNFDKAAYRAGVKIIGVSDFKDYSTPVIDSLTEVAVDAVKESARLEENDIIFVRSNGNKDLVGRCMIIPHTSEELYFSGFCIRCRFKNTIYANPRYFLYLFKSPSFRRQLSNTSVGANIQNLSQSRLAMASVSLPTKEVQDKIASILSAYDDMIDNCKAQIALLEEAAQRLYREWFVDLRFPGHETTPIGENGLPEGWSFVKLESIASYINGFAFKPKHWHNVGLPIIKIKELNEGINDSTPRYPGDDIPQKFHIFSGDIIFSWSATLTANIWNGENGYLNQHLFKVIPNVGYSREFVLQSIFNVLSEFKAMANGSTMQHIQRGKLSEIKILRPSSAIMDKYSIVSDPIRLQILTVSQKLQKAQCLKKFLLPRLISGQIEINA